MVETSCVGCSAVGTLRPDIVWFGEMPFQMEYVQAALQECDLFVSIGTSGAVNPAAAFVDIVNEGGAEQLSHAG